MGKLSTAVVAAVAPGAERSRRAAIGLAIWGVASGTLFAAALFSFWLALGWSPPAAWFAGLFAMVSPLFWFTSARPLTDATALVAAVFVQAVLVRFWNLTRDAERDVRPLVAAAFAAGVLIGLRTQTMWLTGPLVVWLAGRCVLQSRWRAGIAVIGAAAAGCLLWAVPLVVATGGPDAYLAALSAQGREDFAGVEMLATSGGGVLVSEALTSTFIRPWRVAWLGQLMSVLAVIGLARVCWARRAALLVVVLAFGPYLVFHLAFQETETVRYALPVVVPVAGLAMQALFLLPVRAAAVVATLVATASLVTAYPALRAYGGSVPPTFLAYRDAEELARSRTEAPLVVPHTGIQRVADWFRPEWPALPVMAAGDAGWLRLVDQLRTGQAGTAWFMTDRRRSDVALFDPRARRVVAEYLQDPEVRRLVGQARQDDVRWWEIVEPGWMLGAGWALTPEAAGVTFASGRDPLLVPADGYLRRSPAAHRLMIGGRYLSGGNAAVVVAAIDGREVARWRVLPTQPQFLQWIDLPAGQLSGDGPYALLRVRVESAGDAAVPPRIGFEQFDFASAGTVMAGYGAGWHGPEADVDTGAAWRWAGPRASVMVSAGGNTVRLRLAGESSLRYFERASTMVVSVDGAESGRFTVDDDFTTVVEIPADGFSSDPGEVMITMDQMFVPAEREATPDRRELAQRFYVVEVVR